MPPNPVDGPGPAGSSDDRKPCSSDDRKPCSSDDRKRSTVTMPREGSTYMLEVASFDGTGQCIEAEAPQQDLGGESGLTIAAWVRRARTTSTDPRAVDCDRLIDFGNGQQKENIVINFKEGVRCDWPPPPASCHPAPTCASRRSHAATRFGNTPLKRRRASISTGSTSASGAAPCKTGRRSSRRTLGCMWLWCMAVMGPPPSSSMVASAPGDRSRSPRTCRAVRTWTTLTPPHTNHHRCVSRPITTSARCRQLRFLRAETPDCVAANYYVGRSHWGRDPFFKGEMRDVLVTTRALPHSDRTTPPPPSPASLAPPFLLISLRASASCHPCTRPSLSHMPRAVTPFLHLAKVFNYALSRSELSSCAYSRTLPSGGRAAPLMSFASSWREVRGPVTRHGPNDHGPKPKWLWATLAQYDNLARGWGVGGGSRMCATRGVTCAMCGAPMLHYT